DVAEVLRVRLEVSVEEEQRHAPDLGAPHRDAHVARSDGRLDLHSVDLAHRQLVATVLRVDLELPSAGVDVLAPEALPVQKADGDEGKAEVAGRLQVVAG